MFAVIDSFAKIMIIHDKSLAKRFDPEQQITEKCQQLIPLAGVETRARPDLDNYKQRTFFFSISDIPGNIQPSYTFCCQTSVERDRWVDRVAYLSILAVDLVEMERDCRILQQKLFSATTLLKMDVGEKLLENITSGRYKRGTRRYEEVREHLDDYFKIWEGVMSRKMDVHNELRGVKTLASPAQPSDKGMKGKKTEIYRSEDQNQSYYENEVHRDFHHQEQFGSDISRGKISGKDRITSTGSEKTVGSESQQYISPKTTVSKSGKHKQIKENIDLTERSDTPEGRDTEKTTGVSRFRDKSEDERSLQTVTSSVARERARLSDIMKKVLDDSGGKLPAGDDKTKKSILLKRILAEIDKNPQSNFDISKVSKTLEKLGQL